MLRTGTVLARFQAATAGVATRGFYASTAAAADASGLVVNTHQNGVTTLRMNDPKRLNAWTAPMMDALNSELATAAADDNVSAVILTGTGKFYCAGVNLSSIMKPMHPAKLHAWVVRLNQATFDQFIDFPKPIFIAPNGPAIGACVTSATLCDGIIASEKATFSTPFAKLGIVPEGCSSVHFERLMGKDNASRMLDDGWTPTAAEAVDAGLIAKAVPHGALLDEAQAYAEQWVKDGRGRVIVEQGLVDELKAVNAKESVELADAFFGVPFLDNQRKFLESRGKTMPALAFRLLIALRPLWIRMK